MRGKIVGLAMLVLALSGCGGGSKDQPEQEISGVLQAGKVLGVGYSTPTRSGTTDAAGTFKYLAGETVTFYIGAIQLGSARGASAITPFTLAGLTPPTTEPGLRHELERARRQATPFTRAVNIQYLLMSLDEDHNPSNGLDVGAQAGAMVNTSLDLGLPLYTFAGKVQHLAPGITRNIPVTRAVVQLYRAISVSVTAHVASIETTTYSGGLFANSNSTVFGTDGSRTSTGIDYDGDGVPESQYTYGYDALGRITSFYGEQKSVFEDLAYRSTYEYDVAGNLTGGNEDYDYGDDHSVDVRYRHTLSLDSLGRRTGDVVDQDASLDGVIDGREVLKYGYDSRSNNTSFSSDSDVDLDGVLDQKVLFSAGYDDRDRSTGSVFEVDNDANGIVDSRTTDTYELGRGAHPVRDVYEQDYNADGIVDYRAITVSTYDAADNELTRTEDTDSDADGKTDYRQTSESTYDRDGRQLTADLGQDYDGDGTIDYRQREVTTFDAAGNLLTSTIQYLDADGTVEFETIAECHYGPGGERLDCANSSLSNGSVGIQPNSNLAVQNEAFADGVLALAQLYLGN